ncbi:hypothetical protein FRC07_013396 [Ceratobasidium sp. 392]|nr:hypothetical protein FRC07_013396 [Ceratobasidium sp. 392]
MNLSNATEQLQSHSHTPAHTSSPAQHGSFGGSGMGLPEDSIYCAGSDDFRAYAWTIPPSDQLASARRSYDKAQWASEILQDRTGFTTPDDSQVVAVPDSFMQPAFRLGGHRSIVNTAAFHPSLPFIVTAGIENHILMHGTHPMPGGRLTERPERTRLLPPPSSLSRLNFRATTYGLDTMTAEEIALYRSIPRDERAILMFDE